MAIVQASSLLIGRPTPYHVFVSAIEIAACLLFIVRTAWRWAEPSAVVASPAELASASSATSAA